MRLKNMNNGKVILVGFKRFACFQSLDFWLRSDSSGRGRGHCLRMRLNEFGGGRVFSEGFLFPLLSFGTEGTLIVGTTEKEIVFNGSFFNHFFYLIILKFNFL